MEPAEKKKTTKEIQETLGHFSGTNYYYEHGILNRGIKLTDGAQFVKIECSASWLFDIMVSILPIIKKEEFVTFKLVKNKSGSGAKFFATDGNGGILYRQFIQYTDFPLKEIEFFFVGNVVMLKSEY